MKFPIAVSIVILAIGLALGWRDHGQLTATRTTHAQLAAEAALLGIAAHSEHPAATTAAGRSTKRERENRDAETKRFAADLIAFAKEMEAAENKGGPPDEAMQKRIMEFLDRLLSLDAARLKTLISEFQSNTDLKEETRNGLIGISLMTLAEDHPQAALALITESPELAKEHGMGSHVMSSALTRWAKDDPLAALEWVKSNAAKYPDQITDESKRALLSGTAYQDPKLAFKFIGELGFKDPGAEITSIINAAKTPADRTTTLAALREHLATLTDEEQRSTASNEAVSRMARGVAQDGFAAATTWLASANLTADELAGFANGLSYSTATSGDTGHWIEWLGANVPPAKAEAKIKSLVKNWTEKDYQAAGTWLAAAPAGPAKNASVREYAVTVSRYEPSTAAQWALTLPEGKDRESTLKTIQQNWKRQDPAAAAEFARQHNIR